MEKRSKKAMIDKDKKREIFINLIDREIGIKHLFVCHICVCRDKEAVRLKAEAAG